MAVVGFSLADILPADWGWSARLLLAIVVFVLLVLAIAVCSYLRNRNGLDLRLGSNDLDIVVGDLFTRAGMRVIPFNERFDTDVDDKHVSRNSLNGVFVEQYADKPSLGRVIEDVRPTSLDPPTSSDGNLIYPLGTVKPYGDYALMAFTHVDGLQQAHITKSEYEECLLSVWGELSRTYNGRKVVLPLLGSGITRFDDGRPSDDELLRCMLCTLRASGKSFRDGVEVVLTKQTAERMRLYEIRGYAESWG